MITNELIESVSLFTPKRLNPQRVTIHVSGKINIQRIYDHMSYSWKKTLLYQYHEFGQSRLRGCLVPKNFLLISLLIFNRKYTDLVMVLRKTQF